MSATGHAAHPDEIIESCRALQAHLLKLQEDATKMVHDWEEDVRERELAEKRSLAPGWLDRDEKLLEPERLDDKKKEDETDLMGSTRHVSEDGPAQNVSSVHPPGSGRPSNEGEELDRAFGGLGVN